MSVSSLPPHSQNDSPLFRLPAELRATIYAYAFSLDIPIFGRESGLIRSRFDTDPCHVINILQTCRLVYQEAGRSMIHQHTTPYCRNEVVEEMTSYYKFMEKLYLPNDIVEYAPQGSGWTNINPLWLKKSDAVIDLVRHAPYVKGYESQIYTETYCSQYHIPSRLKCSDDPDNLVTDSDEVKEAVKSVMGRIDPDEDIAGTPLPQHAIQIAESQSRYGYDFFFDAQRGTFTICQFQDSRFSDPGGYENLEMEIVWPQSPAEEEEEEEEEEENPSEAESEDPSEEYLSSDEWRAHPTYRPADFFQILKNKFLNVDVLVWGEGEVRNFDGPHYDKKEECKELLKEKGWGTDAWVKDVNIFKKLEELYWWRPEQ